MKHMRFIIISILCLQLLGCAAQQVRQCPSGTQDLPDCPPVNAINDERINTLYASRTWQPPGTLNIDPIRLGEQASIPINNARTKIIGPTYDDALTSLAAKIWLIENARHTLDVMYYIFARDPVGYAILGALCNAVQRGVDVRMMVDSTGSFHPTHDELRALETCAVDAGFMRNAEGQVTTKKARVQVVIFNAMTKMNFNRRSHDKILIADGQFPDRSAVMTGGRNISLDYYGINEDGSRDPTAFRDLEILLRGSQQGVGESGESIGKVSEIYYTLLFLHKGNRRLNPLSDDESTDNQQTYQKEREQSQESLDFIKGLPLLQEHLQKMPTYMSDGFHSSKVRLAHQLGNLTNKDVTTQVIENIERNPNSILYLIDKVARKAIDEGKLSGTLRIISPYLFAGMYYDKQGKVVYDGAKEILQILEDNPDLRIEIVTNSVMTSDNFFTQSIIDMDMAPRFLLTPELQETWVSSLEEGEFNPKLVDSKEWKRLIEHPKIFIYQTGKLDSVLLPGGTTHYGKLHAKYIVGENVGFVGTSNFDYRSNLYNNEMGYFYVDSNVSDDLVEAFELLKSTSYRWGTPEWLQMRRALMESESKKSGPARKQRGTFKGVRALGIEYLM
jgi:phosphatidylserine/phosphatidylglycerophosphate/cardiolipin synthase-like enzyme